MKSTVIKVAGVDEEGMIAESVGDQFRFLGWAANNGGIVTGVPRPTRDGETFIPISEGFGRAIGYPELKQG